MIPQDADIRSSDIEAIGTLEVDLSDIDRRRFAKIRNQKTNKSYLRMEYEVRVSFDYPRLTYEIVIPQNGKFSDLDNWGDNPIRKPAILNCAAAIDINRPRAFESPPRSKSRMLSSVTGNKTADMAGSARSDLRSAKCYTNQRRLESPPQRSCQRCRQLRVKCVRAAFGNPCYKCTRAGQECLSRS